MTHLRWLWAFGLALFVATAAYATPTSLEDDAVPVGKRVKTGISWKVTPSRVEIYLDGRKLGTAGELSFTRVRAGKHTVRLVNGGDETEADVKVVKGQVLQFEFEFTE